MNNAGRGNRSPALNCSFEKVITRPSAFLVDTTSSPSFRNSTITPFGMQNRSRNSFTLSLSVDFSAVSPARTYETAFFFEDIFYPKAGSKTYIQKAQQLNTSDLENSRTLNQNNQEYPRKNLENQQIPKFNTQSQTICPKQVRNQANEQTSATKGKQEQECTYQMEMWRRKVVVATQKHRQEKL